MDAPDTPTLTDAAVLYRRYNYRLDPDPAQIAVLRQQAGSARVTYNMMCAHNRKILDKRNAYKAVLLEAGMEPDQAWNIITQEQKTNPDLKIIGFKEFSTDYLTPERYRHRDAAALIDKGADPAEIWANERYETPWLHTINRHVLNSGLQQCDTAFSNWMASLSGKRRGRKMGLPQFKGKNHTKDSFTVPAENNMGPKGHAKYKQGESTSRKVISDYKHVRLAHLGTFRLFGTTKRLVRTLDRGGRIKSCAIYRLADKWYVSFLVESPGPEVPPRPTKRQYTAGAVGIDLGVNQQAVLSTSEALTNPRLLKKTEKKIKNVQRKIAKCQKGSNNYKALRAREARLHHTLAQRRAGYLHEVTTLLANSFAAIAIEDLNVAGMTASAKGTLEAPGKNVKQKSGLNKSILDTSPGQFRRLLEYKCADRGVKLVAVDRFFPSSQLCSTCGSRTKMPLSERTYHCSTCSVIIDRDVNAAINILNEATRVVEDNCVQVSAPEGAEDKRPWSIHRHHTDILSEMERRRRTGKALVVTAVK